MFSDKDDALGFWNIWAPELAKAPVVSYQYDAENILPHQFKLKTKDEVWIGQNQVCIRIWLNGELITALSLYNGYPHAMLTYQTDDKGVTGYAYLLFDDTQHIMKHLQQLPHSLQNP